MDLKRRVEEALGKIRPQLQMEGGDVELVDVTEDGIVKVRLLGSCAGCPFSRLTLSAGIEGRLRKEIPEIKKVEAV